MTYKQIPNQWKSPRQSEPKDYKGFYHCNNIAVCLSQKDFQFEIIQKKRAEDAIKELVKIIEDDNERYMEYLATPCGWFDFQCKKDRKKTNIFKKF